MSACIRQNCLCHSMYYLNPDATLQLRWLHVASSIQYKQQTWTLAMEDEHETSTSQFSHKPLQLHNCDANFWFNGNATTLIGGSASVSMIDLHQATKPHTHTHGTCLLISIKGCLVYNGIQSAWWHGITLTTKTVHAIHGLLTNINQVMPSI